MFSLDVKARISPIQRLVRVLEHIWTLNGLVLVFPCGNSGRFHFSSVLGKAMKIFATIVTLKTIVHCLTHSFKVCGNIFMVLSIPNHKSWGAEILRECSPPTMCHMSRVICHMSGVRCQVSFFIYIFLNFCLSVSG